MTEQKMSEMEKHSIEDFFFHKVSESFDGNPNITKSDKDRSLHHEISRKRFYSIHENLVSHSLCSLCNKQFVCVNSVKSLRNHVKKYHGANGTGVHDIQSQMSVDNIEKLEELKIMYQCEETKCNLKFNDIALFMGHCIRIHNIARNAVKRLAKNQAKTMFDAKIPVYETIRCMLCDKVFKSKNIESAQEMIKRHVEDKHENKSLALAHSENIILPIKCLVCKREFKSKNPSKARDHLKRHIKHVHEKIPRPERKIKDQLAPVHLCSLCGKIFSEKGNLNSHFQRMHGTESLPCQYCGKILNSHYSLKIHTTYCKVEPCAECGVIIAKRRMKGHIILCHSPYEMRPHKCQYCDIRYLDQPTLNKHIRRVHLNIKPYKCDLCAKAFPQKHFLAIHVKHTHSNEKLYSCEVCNRVYKRPERLSRHRREVHKLLSKYAIDRETRFRLQLLDDVK